MKMCEFEQRLCDIQAALYSGENDIETSVKEVVFVLGDILKSDKLNPLDCYIQYEQIIKSFLASLEAKDSLRRNKIHILSLEKIMNVFSVKKEKNLDGWHSVKRRISFDTFDNLLSFCEAGHCPDMKKEYIYYLSDISINCYIKERSYYYGIDNIGKDDKDRHFRAIKKIENVLSCKRHQKKISPEIFKEDARQIENEYKKSSKNRKAYWGHLTDPLNRPHCNFCNACFFLEEQQKISEKYSSEEYKKLIMNNKDKANAIDLFRFCYIRNNEDN